MVRPDAARSALRTRASPGTDAGRPARSAASGRAAPAPSRIARTAGTAGSRRSRWRSSPGSQVCGTIEKPRRTKYAGSCVKAHSVDEAVRDRPAVQLLDDARPEAAAAAAAGSTTSERTSATARLSGASSAQPTTASSHRDHQEARRAWRARPPRVRGSRWPSSRLALISAWIAGASATVARRISAGSVPARRDARVKPGGVSSTVDGGQGESSASHGHLQGHPPEHVGQGGLEQPEAFGDFRFGDDVAAAAFGPPCSAVRLTSRPRSSAAGDHGAGVAAELEAPHQAGAAHLDVDADAARPSRAGRARRSGPSSRRDRAGRPSSCSRTDSAARQASRLPP